MASASWRSGVPEHLLSDSVLGFLLLLVGTALAVVLFAFALFSVIERLQTALLRRNQEMEALLALGREVTGSLDVDAVAMGATRAVVEATGADAAELWLVEEGRGQVVMRGRHGISPALEQSVVRLGEGLPGSVAADGEGAIMHDVPGDDRLRALGLDGPGAGTLGACPLRAGERTIGVLVVAAESPLAFASPEELRLLDAMSDRIAIAVENALLHEQVQSVAVLTERERIARELHDGMAQVLTYVNTKAHAVDRLLARGQPEDARTQLQQMADTAREQYADVREAILSLRSRTTRDSDLLGVLRQYVREFADTHGLPTEFEAEPEPEQLMRLSSAKELQVLRIVQEALNNVRKHAGAACAWVTIAGSADDLIVCVRDNGRGFEPERLGTGPWPRFGLQSMDERAKTIGGSLEIESDPGRGTSVTLRCPLTSASEE